MMTLSVARLNTANLTNIELSKKLTIFEDFYVNPQSGRVFGNKVKI